MLLEPSVTPTPPAAAGPVKVTVPYDRLPPVTAVGANVKLANAGGVIVRTPTLVMLPRVPDIAAETWLCKGVVLMANVTVVEPPATVTELGTVA